jgi:catechol 2,3-dioxygenase-like lactoylglutathione lyase family enzyme
MRLDHIAYRVANRRATADFFIRALGYRIQQEFQIDFADGSKAECIALEPPEKAQGMPPWTTSLAAIPTDDLDFQDASLSDSEYHLPPEIFVCDGGLESIVGQWVAARGGVGGIHHLAYQVESVQKKMDEWREKGYAEFTSDKPLTCPGLTQVFTKPSSLTGVIYELIERGEHGFCRENVKNLMESTKGL